MHWPNVHASYVRHDWQALPKDPQLASVLPVLQALLESQHPDAQLRESHFGAGTEQALSSAAITTETQTRRSRIGRQHSERAGFIWGDHKLNVSPVLKPPMMSSPNDCTLPPTRR